MANRPNVDVVEAIEDTSRQWRRDCRELFVRVAVLAALHNTDGQLRNHGFLRSVAGWALSPVFDVDPEPDLAVELQTAIIGVADTECDAEALLEFAPLCHITTPEARAILFEVVEAVGHRRQTTVSLPVPGHELETVGEAIETQPERIRAVLG